MSSIRPTRAIGRALITAGALAGFAAAYERLLRAWLMDAARTCEARASDHVAAGGPPTTTSIGDPDVVFLGANDGGAQIAMLNPSRVTLSRSRGGGWEWSLALDRGDFSTRRTAAIVRGSALPGGGPGLLGPGGLGWLRSQTDRG
jgi:hypothetical protein